MLRCHPQDYVDRVTDAIPEEGWVALDGDTHVMAGALEAAMRAGGANCAAVDAVLGGRSRAAGIAVGHGDAQIGLVAGDVELVLRHGERRDRLGGIDDEEALTLVV